MSHIPDAHKELLGRQYGKRLASEIDNTRNTGHALYVDPPTKIN